MPPQPALQRSHSAGAANAASPLANVSRAARLLGHPNPARLSCAQCVGKPQPQFRCACQHSLVTLNFQLLLLQHFVALNFTAVSKILKKFEKKLGVQLRNEYIGALVELPFYRCETLGELVEETERQFNLLQQRGGEAAKAVGAPECWAASSALDSQQQQPSAQCCDSSPAELMPPPPPAIPACGQVPT